MTQFSQVTRPTALIFLVLKKKESELLQVQKTESLVGNCLKT